MPLLGSRFRARACTQIDKPLSRFGFPVTLARQREGPFAVQRASAQTVSWRTDPSVDIPNSVAKSRFWCWRKWILALSRKGDDYWISNRQQRDLCMP
jgi:hypothetical protein